jgi:hypothetical protein
VGLRVIAAETSLPGGGSTAGHVLQFILIHAESGAPTPEQRGLCPRKHLVKGGKSCCGGFRATSAAPPNLELLLLPTQKTHEKLAGEAVLRICSNPYYNAIQDRGRTPNRSRMEANEDWDRMPQYRSPLEKLAKRVEQRSGLRTKEG